MRGSYSATHGVMPTHYSDPDLVALYDVEGRRGREGDFYVPLAGIVPLRILEAGCGTGWLALLLAARGHRVTGLDPAPSMLAAARAKAGADAVTWVEGDMRAFTLQERFDLIVLTGHAFQVLEMVTDISAALICFARHLAPGGRLAFESRNPLAEEWRHWTHEKSVSLEHLWLGPVEIHHQASPATTAEVIDLQSHFHFKRMDERKVSRSRLRFAPRATLDRLLAQAGFSDIAWFGDWDGSVIQPCSLELIGVARRGASRQ